MDQKRTLAIAGLIGLSLAAIPVIRRQDATEPSQQPASGRTDELSVARSLDAALESLWRERSVSSSTSADWRLVVRRLSLALCGTIPSLEEIRALEAQPDATRLDWWMEHLLNDRRYADYFAERLARAFVGTDEGPFLIYRRRRFVTWLADQLAQNRHYDDLVRELVQSEGLWTDQPATNFVTAQERDPIRLAARTARAFLGLRVDCAQCHNHPFADWKQSDFEGLAAFYAPVEQAITGIKDTGEAAFKSVSQSGGSPRTVPAAVPYAKDELPQSGRARQRLAAWIVAPSNTNFAKAAANRVWALLFGMPLVEPVDDLEADSIAPAVLEMLANDFREHGHDLRRLIRVIASTQAFRKAPAAGATTEECQAVFASFPVTRLRPEQVAGAICQAGRLKTIDAASHIFVRLSRFIGENDFVKRFGDAGDEELLARTGTIPQRLLMMNGELARERLKADPFGATGRIAGLAPTDAACVRIAYLITLTRPPTPDEEEHFVKRIASIQGDDRGAAVEDMLWALVNSTEFCWNH